MREDAPAPFFEETRTKHSMTTSTSSHPRVAVVGSVNIDLVVNVDEHVRPGETILATGYAETIGGKGFNQAVAAARDAESHLVGAVGNDPFGDRALEQASGRGVVVTAMSRTDTPTGRAFIDVNRRGENSIVVAPLANHTLTPERVTETLDRIRPAAVLTQLEIPIESVLAAARWCAANDGRFLLNPSPVAEVPVECLRAADPLIVNEVEAADMLAQLDPGHRVATSDSAAVAKALAGFVPSVVVTLGERGSVFASPSGAGHVPVAPVAVVDTTGAGDEFAGTLMAALAGGSSLEAAVEQAGRAASALVGRGRSER